MEKNKTIAVETNEGSNELIMHILRKRGKRNNVDVYKTYSSFKFTSKKEVLRWAETLTKYADIAFCEESE